MSSDDRDQRSALLRTHVIHAAETEDVPAQAATPIPSPAARTRGRHTFYLDSALVVALNRAYRALAHELYPAEVSKSDFLEALLTYGLERGQDIKAALTTRTDKP